MKSFVVWDSNPHHSEYLLIYHILHEYSKQYGDEREFLVIDLNPSTTTSEALLGPQMVQAMVNKKKTVLTCLTTSTDAEAEGWLKDIILPLGGDHSGGGPKSSWLLCGDYYLETLDCSFKDARRALHSLIQKATSKGDWVVLFDVAPSFSVFTKAAVSLSQQLVVPYSTGYPREFEKTMRLVSTLQPHAELSLIVDLRSGPFDMKTMEELYKMAKPFIDTKTAADVPKFLESYVAQLLSTDLRLLEGKEAICNLKVSAAAEGSSRIQTLLTKVGLEDVVSYMEYGRKLVKSEKFDIGVGSLPRPMPKFRRHGTTEKIEQPQTTKQSKFPTKRVPGEKRSAQSLPRQSKKLKSEKISREIVKKSGIVPYSCPSCGKDRIAWVREGSKEPAKCRKSHWKPILRVEDMESDRLDFEPCDPGHPSVAHFLYEHTKKLKEDLLKRITVTKQYQKHLVNPIFLLLVACSNSRLHLDNHAAEGIGRKLQLRKDAVRSVFRRCFIDLENEQGMSARREIHRKWGDGLLNLRREHRPIDQLAKLDARAAEIRSNFLLKGNFSKLYGTSGISVVAQHVKQVWDSICAHPNITIAEFYQADESASRLFQDRQKVFFLGETGKGKSTVINALLAMSTPRFYDETRGFFDPRPALREMPPPTTHDRQDADNAHLQAYIEVKDKAVVFKPQDFYLLPVGNTFGGCTPAPVEVKYSETFTIEFSFMAWEEIREEVFNVRINKKSLNDGEEEGSFLLKRMKAFTRNDAKKEDNKDAKDESSSSDDDDDDDDDDWETVTLEEIELAKELDVLKKNSNCSWTSILRYLEERGASVTTKWIEACWDEDKDEDEDDEISIGDKDSDDEMTDGNEEEKEDIVDRPTVIFSGRGESLQQDRKLMQQILTDVLCQHPPLACSLKSIVVGVPSLLLQGGITLVDTPGANDGNEINRHNLKKMLEKERDHCSALIITENMWLNDVLEDVLRSSGLSKNGRYAVMHNSELKGLSSLERAKQDWHENKKTFKKHRAGCAKKLRKFAGEEHDELDVYKERVITARPTLAASLSVSGDMWWSNCDNLLGLSDLLDKINKLSVDNWVAHADEFVDHCGWFAQALVGYEADNSSGSWPPGNDGFLKRVDNSKNYLKLLESVSESVSKAVGVLPKFNDIKRNNLKESCDRLEDLHESTTNDIAVNNHLVFANYMKGMFSKEGNSLVDAIVPMSTVEDASEVGKGFARELRVWATKSTENIVRDLIKLEKLQIGNKTDTDNFVCKTVESIVKTIKEPRDSKLQALREHLAIKAIRKHDKKQSQNLENRELSKDFLTKKRLIRYRKLFVDEYFKYLQRWFRDESKGIQRFLNEHGGEKVVDAIIRQVRPKTRRPSPKTRAAVQGLIKQLNDLKTTISGEDSAIRARGLFRKLMRCSIIGQILRKSTDEVMKEATLSDFEPRIIQTSDVDRSIFSEFKALCEVRKTSGTVEVAKGVLEDFKREVCESHAQGNSGGNPEERAEKFLLTFLSNCIDVSDVEACYDLRNELKRTFLTGFSNTDANVNLGEPMEYLLMFSSFYNLCVLLTYGDNKKTIRLLDGVDGTASVSVQVVGYSEDNGFEFSIPESSPEENDSQEEEIEINDDSHDEGEVDTFFSFLYQPVSGGKMEIERRKFSNSDAVQSNVNLESISVQGKSLSKGAFQQAEDGHIHFTNIGRVEPHEDDGIKAEHVKFFAAPHALAVVNGDLHYPHSGHFTSFLLRRLVVRSLHNWESGEFNRSHWIVGSAVPKDIESYPPTQIGQACLAFASVKRNTIDIWGCGDCRAFVLCKEGGHWCPKYSSSPCFLRIRNKRVPTQISSRASSRANTKLLMLDKDVDKDVDKDQRFSHEVPVIPGAHYLVVLGSSGLWKGLGRYPPEDIGRALCEKLADTEPSRWAAVIRDAVVELRSAKQRTDHSDDDTDNEDGDYTLLIGSVNSPK